MAGLTVRECVLEVTHSLNSRMPSDELSVLSIINEAGAHFCNMHPWRFLIRYSTAMNYVAGQSYVDLPGDLSEPLSDPVPLNGFGFKMTDLSEVVEARYGGATGRPIIGAYGYPSFAGTAEPGGLNLQVYPTPQANETGVLALYYRAKWLDASSDSDFVDVRPEYRMLYKQILRAYAQGLEEEGANEKIAAIEMGPIALAAKKHDGRQQPYAGRMRGGAIELARLRRGDFTGVYPLARSIT